jgi:hypothetical protein
LVKKDNEKEQKIHSRKQWKTVKKKEKFPQENNNLFVYFFHSVEICCITNNEIVWIWSKGDNVVPLTLTNPNSEPPTNQT